MTSSTQKLGRRHGGATGSGGSGEAHIVAKVLYTLGESGSDAGLVAFDEIVSAEVLTLHTGAGREAYLLLPVIPADRPGVRATKPVTHNGKDGQIAR